MYNEYSYRDDDEDYVSPVEDELLDYLYNDSMSPEDKYIYELCDSLYKKCANLYDKDNFSCDLEWDAFPYEEMSKKFPHTYNQILIHLIEASNNRHCRSEPNNTIYGNGSGSFWLSNKIRTTTPEIISIVEMLAKYVNIVIRGIKIDGIVQLMFLYGFVYGSISVFDTIHQIRPYASGDVDLVFKTCPEYLLHYMCYSPELISGFDLVSLQKNRIHMVNSISTDIVKLYVGNYINYCPLQFMKALNNRLYLIAEFIIVECKKHNIGLYNCDQFSEKILESGFIDACNKCDLDSVQIYCKLDPYKYDVIYLPVIHVDCDGHTENSHMMISNKDYGIIYSPKNKKWQRMCVIMQALHYNKNNLPMDVVRMISSF
jgi:hypothetical protein